MPAILFDWGFLQLVLSVSDRNRRFIRGNMLFRRYSRNGNRGE